MKTDLDRRRLELEHLLLAGRRPTDPEVLKVSRRLDQLVAKEMKKPTNGRAPARHRPYFGRLSPSGGVPTGAAS